MISTILMLVFWIVCCVMCVLYNSEVEHNKELQQENTELIERNLELDKLNRELSKDALSDIDKILKLDKKLREAKELLEVQDKLIKNIE